MRLVALAASFSAAGALASVPPPPPPPLTNEYPEEIGGYSTNAMNAVYQYWLSRQVAEAGKLAMDRTAPKPFREATGEPVFLLRRGPRVSAATAWRDSADYWHFDYVCPAADPRATPEGAADIFAHLERVGGECVWQVTWGKARFRNLSKSGGRLRLQPDFERLSALMRAAGVQEVQDGTVPEQVFKELGDPMPFMVDEAVQIRKTSANDCPEVLHVLQNLEQKKLDVDFDKVGESRISVAPHHHASLFQAELAITHGGNGHGSAQLSDYGSGFAYESWKAADEKIGPCFGKSPVS